MGGKGNEVGGRGDEVGGRANVAIVDVRDDGMDEIGDVVHR